MTKGKWGLLALLLAAGLLAGAIATGRIALPQSALDVETARVTRGPLTVTVDEEGRTRVRDRYIVAAPVAGRIARIVIKEGASVTSGDLLARVYPTPEDPRAVEVARARLAAAEARQVEAAARVATDQDRQAQTVRDLTRTTDLADAGVASRDLLEQARLAATTAGRQLDMSRAALRAVEADVASAQAALVGIDPDGTEGTPVAVRAPADGRVLRVPQESARVVQAGTPLVEIGDAAGLEVVVDVLSEDAVRIAPGDPVLIEEWGGDEQLRGTVRLIEPEAFTKISALGVEEQRVNIVVDLPDPPATLGAGYRLEARIVTWHSDDVLLAPTSALFQRNDGWVAFLVVEGLAEQRAVTIGHRSTDAAEVIAGLAEGDRLILYPSALVDDGVPVQ